MSTLQEQNHNPGEVEAKYLKRSAQWGPGGPLLGSVQTGDGTTTAGKNEPCGGAATNTC